MTITIGAFLNATGILLGALVGLLRRKPIAAPSQFFFKNALGAFTFFFGIRLVWLSLNGAFFNCLGQLFIALLAVVLGHLLGKILSLQKISNHLGHQAARAIAAAQKAPGQHQQDGLNACVILFCAAPLGILGAVDDGLFNYFWLLAVKAVMDFLAMMSFVRIFRWPSALSAFAVYALFSLVALGCRVYAGPLLNPPGLAASVGAASGLIACAIALVIFEVRRVELANYLPALVLAPLLTWLFKAL
ncbi:MAG: DUF554 family protein [Limisphaerales bacterium]